MKFLLNMNVPRELGRRLAAEGHECRHLGDIGMARAMDAGVIDEARAAQETVVTHDLDYGNLLAFSGEPAPSVIILRLRRTHPDYLFTRLMGILPEIVKSLDEGSIVVMEDAAYRVRRLPIARET